MALLTLKDIGKIYVSEGSVAVGIRGVNLSFERGEFVAVTGKSGSGKSTLLNVISGMDTYEEGELYIEGQPTSHYVQPDWEEYRRKYISFIFQDYNIIESFTVLENVELALMHIENKKERKKRALELLTRVGLRDRIHQKGSQLSGGQKQRTVIARALAKDSPIILADEPTGNLDSKTSAEIIELMREVSKDKLLIMVTHNFDQVEHFATRHIRVFDGAVESDHVISAPQPVTAEPQIATNGENRTAMSAIKPKKQKRKTVQDGCTLGWAIFKSRPKLSVFLCTLLIIGALAIFAVTSACNEGMSGLFTKPTLFSHRTGRLVIARQTGEVITENDLQKLAEEYGAKSYLPYDVLLDEKDDCMFQNVNEFSYFYLSYRYACNGYYGDNIIGRYPTADNEIFFYLPVYMKEIFGTSAPTGKLCIFNVNYNVTGFKYFYDNNMDAEISFTESGFRTATALYGLANRQYDGVSLDASLTVSYEGTEGETGNKGDSFSCNVLPAFGLEKGTVYLEDALSRLQITLPENYTVSVNVMRKETASNRQLTQDNVTQTPPLTSFNNVYNHDYKVDNDERPVYVDPSILKEMAEEVFAKTYTQGSLFFESDAAARAAVSKLKSAGFVAVPSDTIYEADGFEAISDVLMGLFMLLTWIFAILFLALFISLCTSRTLGAFKKDMAIMRSMGIPVKVIRLSMYVRTLISLIPAYLFTMAAAFIIYLTPVLNGMFTFLYAGHYILIGLGMLLMTLLVTRRQIKKLFKTSVKKSLKGGAAV